MALPAIISPSVLASDFGQLTAECKRMIKGGAEWLHMGQSSLSSLFTQPRTFLHTAFCIVHCLLRGCARSDHRSSSADVMDG